MLYIVSVLYNSLYTIFFVCTWMLGVMFPDITQEKHPEISFPLILWDTTLQSLASRYAQEGIPEPVDPNSVIVLFIILSQPRFFKAHFQPVYFSGW